MCSCTMLKTLVLLFVAHIFIASLCSAQFSNNQNADAALDKIWEGNAAFTRNFLRLKTNENPEEGFIASPFSVLLPLAQLALYASGTTYNQILNVLNVDSTNEIREGFRKLLDNFKLPKKVELSLAQKVFGNVAQEFTQEFKFDTKEYFDAEAQNLDFSKNEQAANIINDWVNKQTNGLIPQLLEANMLDSFTQMVLVNAIYFKGNWLYPFDPAVTKPKDFYVTKDKKITVDMMYQEGSFKYAEISKLQIKAVELMYKDKDYSLLIVLPSSEDNYSLERTVQNIQDPNVFKEIFNELAYDEVEVHLPSIETSTTTDLKEILKGVNVTAVFDPNYAEISRLLKDRQQLYVSAAIQKAVLVINELGSEVAVANAVATGVRMAIVTPAIFNANRPFLYFVLYKRNVLFSGTYTGS